MSKLAQVREALRRGDGSMPTNQLIPLTLHHDERFMPGPRSDEKRVEFMRDFLMVDDRVSTVATVDAARGEDETNAKIAIERAGEETGEPLFH